MEKTIQFAYGQGTMPLTLSEEHILYEIEGAPSNAIEDVAQATLEALRNPIGTPALREIVKKGETVAIVVSDITRSWIKSYAFLPTILNELNDAGIPDKDIFIVIALGTHRPHTHEEDVSVCGEEVVNRVRILQHDGLDESQLTYLGETTRGTKAYVNSHVVNADRVILTGGIAFHLMAGFGGGRKSIMPGVSGDKTIQGNHSLALHPTAGMGSNPLCESGKLEGNPVHEDMVEVAAMVKPDFLVNGVYTAEGKFHQIVAGHWHDAWREGCKSVEKIFGIKIQEKADAVIASAGGFPKDINLYQGSKTIDNAFMATKPNGVFICLLECPDIKEPPIFSSWFRFDDIQEFEQAVRDDFSIPAFIAFKCADIAKKMTVILVTRPENADFVKRTGMIPVSTLDEAWRMAEARLADKPDYKVTVMTHGANTVPTMEKK